MIILHKDYSGHEKMQKQIKLKQLSQNKIIDKKETENLENNMDIHEFALQANEINSTNKSLD